MSALSIGVQQDFCAFWIAPALCALFRAAFILWYRPYRSFMGKGRALYHCFRYGFWWGMDFNAYVFLGLFLLVTLPGSLLPAYFAVGDTVRVVVVTSYALLLYAAFWGKMIFYAHYHDTFNELVWLGKNAEKHNLADVFFHENHGGLVLLSFFPFGILTARFTYVVLALPVVFLPQVSAPLSYALVGLLCFLAVAWFYFCRYGGTFMHDDKPEWDTIPSVVKKDIFLARATMDDLVALKQVYQHPLSGLLTHTDAMDAPVIDRVMPEGARGRWQELSSPAAAFVRRAKGPHIAKPRHIFLIVEESYAQHPLDDIYAGLHLADGGRRFRAEAHTASLANFLPAGMLSRPAIVSLMTGIFDARLELNEREAFWKGTVATSLPLQLKKLGYRSIYWYGGNATYGNFNQYAPAVGFDEVRAAVDICPPDAPRTWVGVYDHIFLEEAAREIREMEDVPTFHFVYTTSNHGPYKMDLAKYGYDAAKVMPDMPAALLRDHHQQQVMGTYWYADWALTDFVDAIREDYPDSLVLVTGDHSFNPVPLQTGIFGRTELTLREQFCTSFAMWHQELDQHIFAENTIGGHMNILPTIFELIAPQDFQYYSLFPSLTEPIHHVVTPYHWLDTEAIGGAADGRFQGLAATSNPVATELDPTGQARYRSEIDGYTSVTGWIARHPELLRSYREH